MERRRWSGGGRLLKMRPGSNSASIQSLDSAILCLIFSSLDPLDLARCSTVCKSWNDIVHASNLLKDLYTKQQTSSTDLSKVAFPPEKSLKLYLEELAMKQHQSSLVSGSLEVYQWKAHFSGANQCRMKMGLILTGAGDKVIRLWSSESLQCLGEYSVSGLAPLVDFDFDESKIVGLVGTRVCIWQRHGKRSIFPSKEGTFTRGLSMRYIDPHAAIGCEDGTVRVFDMYSRICSRIIRMHNGPVTCLALTEDQLIVSGSSLGSITVSSLSSDQRVASLKSASAPTGIRSLCFNPSSYLVFAGSTDGLTHCWDLRTMRPLWERRVSSNVVYTLQHMRNDTSTLVVGGIDGVLRILNQKTGELLASYVLDNDAVTAALPANKVGVVAKREGMAISADTYLDDVPRKQRPPIACLAVGMKKIVTSHNGTYMRLWKFN